MPSLTIQSRDVLARLKSETADAHARIDAIADPALSNRNAYRQLLLGMRDAHQALEPELHRHADALARAGYDVAQRSKLSWLDADLALLGATSAHPPPSIELRDASEAFGAVYVIEGATLGGQVIARRVIPTLALSPDAGCRYFSGYGAATRDRWLETRDAIGAHVASLESPDGITRMIAAANETFALFARAMSARIRS
jgi:heme oxygenase